MTNSDTRENYVQDEKNFKNVNMAPQGSDPNSNPYDSENLDNESDSESKDITEKDIEEDLINNDPSEGFETDLDTPKSNEAESSPFETIQPDKDNPVHKEFEIGHLGNIENFNLLKFNPAFHSDAQQGMTGRSKP